MPVLFSIEGGLLTLLSVALFAAQGWALVDALTHRPDAYVAGDKMTKPAWSIILGLAVAAHLLIWTPFHFLNLIGAVAAIVYLVDARPTLRSLTRR